MNKYPADNNYKIRFYVSCSSDNLEVTLEAFKYLPLQRCVVFSLCIKRQPSDKKKQYIEAYLVKKQTYKRRRNGGTK